VLLVDEGRLAAGLGPAVAARPDARALLVHTPATLLEWLIGARVVGESERRAILRALARSRDDIGLPSAVIESASFAHRAAATFADREHPERPFFEPLIAYYRTLLAFGNVYDEGSALAKAIGESPLTQTPHVIVDAVLLVGERGFMWRRLFAAQAIEVESIDLGPLEPAALDRGLIDAIATLIRFAAGERDADAPRCDRPALADRSRRRECASGCRGRTRAPRSDRKRPRQPRPGGRACRITPARSTRCDRLRVPRAGCGCGQRARRDRRRDAHRARSG